MAAITPPNGYVSWNQYIDSQTITTTDINSRRLAKRDIKLGMIAQIDRQTVGNSYRSYNTYVSPGTTSPLDGHPFILSNNITDEFGNTITDEFGNMIIV